MPTPMEQQDRGQDLDGRVEAWCRTRSSMQPSGHKWPLLPGHSLRLCTRSNSTEYWHLYRLLIKDSMHYKNGFLKLSVCWGGRSNVLLSPPPPYYSFLTKTTGAKNNRGRHKSLRYLPHVIKHFFFKCIMLHRVWGIRLVPCPQQTDDESWIK